MATCRGSASTTTRLRSVHHPGPPAVVTVSLTTRRPAIAVPLIRHDYIVSNRVTLCYVAIDGHGQLAARAVNTRHVNTVNIVGMADSDSLRTRRHRRHKRGDHSLCVRCDAVRAAIPVQEGRIRAPRAVLPPDDAPEGHVDALAALERQARRLEQACEEDPGNAALERELRITLQALPAPEGPADPLDELRELAARVS